jgi:uncharacterized membrane protein
VWSLRGARYRDAVRTGRVEAFSDGVLAILITILVLEIPKPEEATWAALGREWHVLVAYALSFLYIGIYWSNHHNMLQAVQRIRGGVLWANLNLLFWLSLVPWITGWLGEAWNPPEAVPVVPVVVYGIALLLAGASYWVLQASLIRAEGPDSALAAAVGRDVKGKGTPLLYATGIAVSFFAPWLGLAIYFVIAAIWLIPDRRVERQLAHRSGRVDLDEG